MRYLNFSGFKIVLFLAVLFFCADANGQLEEGKEPRERKGFIIGFGIGPGMTSYKLTADGFGDSDRESEFGLQTDFKIGYAPSNHLEIYYSNKVSWFSLEDSFGDNVLTVSGLSSIASSYFFKPEGPSPFVSVGVGLASWRTPFEETASAWSNSFGFFIGGGYEFSSHWDVSANIIQGNTSITDFGPKINNNALTFQLTINVMHY